MSSYIAIQNTYDIFEMALFHNDTVIDHVREDKRHTSKLFIPLLDQLLAKNNVQITDLSFCAVNCGPGPFSTLRSIIASVNGLHLATTIPLIGIDGLDATFLEFYDNTYAYNIVLLNAFNNEVYYLIAHQNHIVSKGYKKIDLFLDEIKQTILQPINLIGNGVTLHHDLIREILGNNAIIKVPNSAMCTVNMIGQLGLKKWQNNQDGKPEEALAKTGLMPLHLKKHAVEL